MTWGDLVETLRQLDPDLDYWRQRVERSEMWDEVRDAQCPSARAIKQGDALVEQASRAKSWEEREKLETKAVESYERAVQSADTPKVQTEVACLLLARAGVLRGTLAWAYPFHLVNEYSELFERPSLADEFLDECPRLDSPRILKSAEKAAGRAFAFFNGFEHGVSDRPYSLDEAWLWVEPSARALTLSFAALSRTTNDDSSRAVEDLVEFFEEWLPGESFPELVVNALPSPRPPDTTAAFRDRLETAAGGSWMHLCRETKRHLLHAELYASLATAGQLEADEAILRYCRAFEAQVVYILSHLAGIPVRFRDFIRLRDVENGLLKPGPDFDRGIRRIRERLERDSMMRDFLFDGVPAAWNALNERNRRNFAAHGDPNSRPLKLKDLRETRRLLLEQGSWPSATLIASLGHLAMDVG